MAAKASRQGRKAQSEGYNVAVDLMKLGLSLIKDPPPPLVLPKEAPTERR